MKLPMVGGARPLQHKMAAIERVQATIEFELDGTIITANENFLKTMGYALYEIVGRHHSIFVAPGDAEAAADRQLWDDLRRGEFRVGEFRRLDKSGEEFWIQAFYMPLLDNQSRPYQVMQFATDITDQVRERAGRAELQRAIDADLRDMAGAIEATSDQAARAAAASNQTSSNVQSVASAAEELAASILEIAGQVATASDITSTAVEQAERSSAIIASLSASAQKIGAVVALISDIAEQTNLLALNATIEAARAGEAGKGFAVVAAEVKQLATQSARATDEISGQISGIQGATDEAVAAIREIGEVIARIADIATAIAGGVEQQSAVTKEITSNMQTASSGVNSISEGMNEIADATERMNEAAKKLTDASAALG